MGNGGRGIPGSMVQIQIDFGRLTGQGKTEGLRVPRVWLSQWMRWEDG